MNRNGYDSERMDELIHKYLSGETTPEETVEVEAWLSAHPEVQVRLKESEGIRDRLRQAVANEPVPESLRENLLQTLATPNLIRPDRQKRERKFPLPLPYLYGAVGVVLLLIIGWFVFRSPNNEPDPGKTELASVEATNQIAELLQVGMNDHLQCAVAFHKGDIPEYGQEKMRAELAKRTETLEEDFSSLIPIAQEKIEEGKLLVAHKCTFGGRHYVHMILKGDENMISVIITRKQEGESLAARKGRGAKVGNIPIHHASLNGYEIAGFDTEQFLVYVASDLPEEKNLHIAAAVAEPVRDLLTEI